MEAKVKEEVLNWSKTDDGETFELLIGVELEVPKGTDKGQVAALRKGMSLSITRLTRLMRDAQTTALGETEIKVETLQKEGKPFRVSQMTFGKEVPGMPWKPGGPGIGEEVPELPETTEE
jgi:hypothetical protein